MAYEPLIAECLIIITSSGAAPLLTILYFHPQINKSTFNKIEESTEKQNTSEKGRATIIFSLKNEVGGLVKALKLFQVSCLTDAFFPLMDKYLEFV